VKTLAVLFALALALVPGCSKKEKSSDRPSTGGKLNPETRDRGSEKKPDDQPPPPESPLIWTADEKAALARAKSEKRPVLVDFGAEWCAPCKDFEQKTFTDAAVVERLSSMVLLRFDVTEQTEADEEVQKRYDATNLPTLLALSADGEERVRITEFLEPKEFLAALAKLE